MVCVSAEGVTIGTYRYKVLFVILLSPPKVVYVISSKLAVLNVM